MFVLQHDKAVLTQPHYKNQIFIFNYLPAKLRYISLGSELEEGFLSFKNELCELLLVVNAMPSLNRCSKK